MKKNIFILRRHTHLAKVFFMSFLFSVITCIVTFFYGIFSLSFFILPFAWRYYLLTVWTRFIVFALKKLCGVNYRVRGIENIKKAPVCVVMSNHQSAWETFFLLNLFRCSTFVIKKELLWVPFFGWGLRAIHPIAIKRSSAKAALMQLLSEGASLIKNNRYVIIFPEGTRVLPGETGRYRPGGAHLAIAAECGVLPVAHNAGIFWGKKRFMKYPGTIDVIIGPWIDSANKSSSLLLAEVKSWIEDASQSLPRSCIASDDLPAEI
jgi:1-acyl-sn-glycerol-3-phosphate acyltransferase